MAALAKSKKNLQTILGGSLLVGLVLLAVVAVRLYELEKPQVDLSTDLSILGQSAEISFTATDRKSGIRHLEFFMVQGEKRFRVHEEIFQRQGYFSKAGPNRLQKIFQMDTASLGFTDGRADLVVTARDFSFWHWMKGNEATVSYPVMLDTQAPKIWMADSPGAIKPGSAGIVVYRVSEPLAKHGVEISGRFHPGFPIPARGDDMHGAMIGIPHDAKAIGKAVVRAVDRAGNQGSISFAISLRKVSGKADRINISDSFLEKKIPEFAQYYPEIQAQGSLLEQYVFVNNKIRTDNAERIRQICATSQPERLWDGRFKRMRRSSRRAGYADYRSYYYGDKKIDNQYHLGIDLASVRRAEVEAANRGVVAFADYLGIYGNMVVLDHGQGVFSLYSHLSQTLVKEGDQVEKGALLGNTGISGMAGGDHLHFSMLVNGVFVNPLEWWDQSWLELNILNYLK